MLGWGVLQNISGDFVANEIVMKYIHPISRDVLYSISLKSINTSKMNLDVGKLVANGVKCRNTCICICIFTLNKGK